MTTVTKWSKVQVALQSALATAITITAISKANPGVVTYTGTDPANGDFVVVNASGMYQLDSRVFRVTNVNAGANTLELEGEDTTNYDTFTSGTAQVITFGTTMQTATGLTASGGDFDFLDVTTIHDNVKKQIPGLAGAATYSFENIWDPADPALKAMKVAADNQALRAVKFTFANGQIVTFNGYVGCTLLPTGNAQELVKTNAVITMFGRPTIYSA